MCEAILKSLPNWHILRRRWTNIDPTLGKCIMFAGIVPEKVLCSYHVAVRWEVNLDHSWVNVPWVRLHGL